MTSTRHTRLPAFPVDITALHGKIILLFEMPRLNENTERQLHELEHGTRTGTLRAWDSFSNFALRDNVLEVAVGLM